MRIAISSPRLEIPKTPHEFYLIPNQKVSEVDLRVGLKLLSNVDYFVTDRTNKWIGIYIGFALAHNISYVTVNLGTNSFYGSYADLTRREWREFSRALPDAGEITELHYPN